MRSHFNANYVNTREYKITSQTESLEAIESAGELGALLLESALVKKHQPLYNRKLRNARQMVVLKEARKDDYLTCRLEISQQIPPGDLGQILAVFRSRREALSALAYLADQYHLCKKLLGVEKSPKDCFGYQLGTCQGACLGRESSISYNLRFRQATGPLRIKNWPYKGPIIIEEGNGFSEKTERFLFNKWCFLGKVENENELSDCHLSGRFDLDIYKILLKYLNSKKQRKIFVLERTSETFDSEQFLT